jgi:hypothetical protein
MTRMSETLLLDDVLPRFDVTRLEHRVIDGDRETVYGGLMQADFLSAWRDSTAVRALFALRSAAERVAQLGRERQAPPPPPQTLRTSDITSHGEWVSLAEEPPREFVFGAIGRFWSGETKWETIEAAEFTTFDQPGFAKIAGSFSLRHYGGGRTLLTYEARTSATDPASRRAFMRYWWVVSPFVGVVMRSMLAVVEREANTVGGVKP